MTSPTRRTLLRGFLALPVAARLAPAVVAPVETWSNMLSNPMPITRDALVSARSFIVEIMAAQQRAAELNAQQRREAYLRTVNDMISDQWAEIIHDTAVFGEPHGV